MKTKATRKLKGRIRGGSDNPNYNNAVFREQDLKDYIIKETNSSNAPYISDEDAVRLKAELPDKHNFIDGMLRAQAEKQKKEQEELIVETQKIQEAARKNLDESVGSCTSYVETTDKDYCEEKRGTYDQQDNSCHYTPVNVKSQRECAAMQTRASIKNKVYHKFQETDHSRAPVIYSESFLDSFEWDRNDKAALVFYLEKISQRLNEIIEKLKKDRRLSAADNVLLETESKDIYTKLYNILSESIVYYLKLEDYGFIRKILGLCPTAVVDLLGSIPEKMLNTWVAEFKDSPSDQQNAFEKVKNDVEFFGSFATWLDTNKYPELRKRILAEGMRALQRGNVNGGRSSYTKLRRKSRRRKHRISARKPIK